jgi:hypothetical protein
LLAKVASCAVLGLEGAIVEVEVDISPGLPVFNRYAMPDPAKSDEKMRPRQRLRYNGASGEPLSGGAPTLLALLAVKPLRSRLQPSARSP